MLEQLLFDLKQPITKAMIGDSLDSHHAFIVQYKVRNICSLRLHQS